MYPAESSSEQKSQQAFMGNVYPIFLCPLVQSPCSIPLITVSTISTFNPAPIHPQSSRNLLIHLCLICMELKTTVNILPHIICPLEPTGSTFAQLRPEQSSEYRSTRPTVVYFIVQLSNCVLLTNRGHNPDQPSTEMALRGEGQNTSPSVSALSTCMSVKK